MAAYPIGEVERLLGVKAHTLRYWEKEIPLLQPRKDSFGRRVYSGRDLGLLLRLKHLLHDRHFTIEGAREQLIAELSDASQDARGMLEAIRAELASVYFISVHAREQADRAHEIIMAPHNSKGTPV